MAPPSRSVARAVTSLVLFLVGILVVWLLAIGPRSDPGATSEPGRSAITATATASASRQSATTPRSTSIPSTVSPTGASAVLVGAGDIADCASNGDAATARLLDGIDGTVFTLGDNVYESGTPSEFRHCYDPTWGRQLGRTKPVPGNHDYGTAGAAGYFGYFGAAAGDPRTGYYAYDAGAWRVYVINSNCALIGGCDAGSTQERWLRHDLAANAHACVLAMWHHPRFSSGEHGNDPITEDLWHALYDAGAELILNGHDHDYERFAAQAPSGKADTERGIIEMVVGTGGRSHYDFPVVRAHSLVRDNATYGVLRLELSDGGWSFEFVPVPGRSFTDSGSGTCH